MGTKITIELPEWAEERHIYVMAGLENVAVKKANSDEVLIKTETCNYCGKCCMNIPYPEKFPLPTVNGNCIHLDVYDNGKTECKLGFFMPFACAIGGPVSANWKDKDMCCIKYDKKGTVIKD